MTNQKTDRQRLVEARRLNVELEAQRRTLMLDARRYGAAYTHLLDAVQAIANAGPAEMRARVELAEVAMEEARSMVKKSTADYQRLRAMRDLAA